MSVCIERKVQQMPTPLHMSVNGHFFTKFKSVERICWKCGFVIPDSFDMEELRRWKPLQQWGACSGKWLAKTGS